MVLLGGPFEVKKGAFRLFVCVGAVGSFLRSPNQHTSVCVYLGERKCGSTQSNHEARRTVEGKSKENHIRTERCFFASATLRSASEDRQKGNGCLCTVKA